MHLLHIRTSRSCIPVEISCPRSYSFPGMHISTTGIDLLRTNGAADFLAPRNCTFPSTWQTLCPSSTRGVSAEKIIFSWADLAGILNFHANPLQ